MNKLIVPRESIIKSVFINSFRVKNASMSSFWAAPLIGELVIACMVFVYIFVFKINWGHSLLVIMPLAIFYYLMRLWAVHSYRSKIIKDMKSAEPIQVGFYGSRNVLYFNYIATMAGQLKFVTDESITFDIEKRRGKLYEYYHYANVDDINVKDLRIFISSEDELD